MKPLITAIVTLLCAVALTLSIIEGYQHPWTGFAEHQPTSKDVQRAKTLWDWLDLLVVPIVLAVGAFALDGSRKRSERAIEIDRQMQQVLDSYFDNISELLLSNQLGKAPPDDMTRKLARTRTLAALRLLDGRRKSQVLQFLYEARLIEADPVINLNGADFRGALLDEATLSGAEVRGAYFAGASIRNSTLVGSDLRGSDFSSVDFTMSNLTNARLVQARLDGANIQMARIDGADFSDVDLRRLRMTFEQRSQLTQQPNQGDENG